MQQLDFSRDFGAWPHGTTQIDCQNQRLRVPRTRLMWRRTS